MVVIFPINSASEHGHGQEMETKISETQSGNMDGEAKKPQFQIPSTSLWKEKATKKKEDDKKTRNPSS